MKITKEKNNVKQGTNSYGRGIISINTGLSTKEKKKKKNKKPRGRKPFAMQNLASPVFCFCLPLIQSRVFFWCYCSRVLFFGLGLAGGASPN